MSTHATILVAGIGNIFFGDDAFGCEVVKELGGRELSPLVRVIDFGIRSYDLAYAIMDNYTATILVDAVARGHKPGTVFLIRPDVDTLPEATPDGHSMNPASVLQLARSLGGEPKNLYLVGCEPSVLETEEGEMGLSKIVQAAVPHAVETIEKLLHDLLHPNER